MTNFVEETAIPRGDPSRQAVEALGGYAYQLYLSCIAWARLEPNEILYLEIAEDFAVVARGALQAVQVKASRRTLTLNSRDAIAAIDSLIRLQKQNPDSRVRLVYHTAADEGTERRKSDRIEDKAGIAYWRDVLNGADAEPLRHRILALNLKVETKHHIGGLSLEGFTNEVVSRLEWRCGQHSMIDAKKELEDVMVKYGRVLNVHPEDCATALGVVVARALEKATEKGERSLGPEEFGVVFRGATSVRIDNQHFRAMAEDLVYSQPCLSG